MVFQLLLANYSYKEEHGEGGNKQKWGYLEVGVGIEEAVIAAGLHAEGDCMELG